MAHNTPEEKVPAAHPGHEISDLDVSYVRWFSLGIVMLVILSAAAAFFLLSGWRIPRAATADAAAAEESAAAPFATLQSEPQNELRSYRRSKASELDGYGWVDRAGGVVHIPIDRAMELMATEARTR